MPTLNKISENMAIRIDGNKVTTEKKVKYLKLVSDPNLPLFLFLNIVKICLKIIAKKNANKSKSKNNNIFRLKSFNSIKP